MNRKNSLSNSRASYEFPDLSCFAFMFERGFISTGGNGDFGGQAGDGNGSLTNEE